MNWVRPLHRWILDPVCWVLREMVQDMLNGLIEVPPHRIATYIRVLVALSPRNNKGIILNALNLRILVKKEIS